MKVIKLLLVKLLRFAINLESQFVHSKKLELLHEKYSKLKKRRTKMQSETQKANEAVFLNNLDNLFEIAHMNAQLQST